MNNFRKPGAPRKARRGAVGRAPAWTRLGSAAVLASLFCLAAPPAAKRGRHTFGRNHKARLAAGDQTR